MIDFQPVDIAAMSQYKTASAAQGNTATSFSNIVASVSAPNSLDAIFEQAAQTYQVPVSLLKAIGKAESNFNPQAVSSAGAQGVMQLMPATAASLGVTDSFNAEQNIMGGAKYIKQMLDRYDGDVKLALAAYNAGSGNVAKYGGIPPFPETQNYVRKVMGYAGETLTAGYDTSSSLSSAPTSLEEAILQFQDFTQDDYLLFIESLKNDMSNSLLKTLNGDSRDSDENTLFQTTKTMEQYNNLLHNLDIENAGLSSNTAHLLGNRFQTFYDQEL